MEHIPSGLITCLYDNSEYKILNISDILLNIRTDELLDDNKELKIAFHSFKNNMYKELIIKDYKFLNKIKHKFSYEYKIEINSEEYKNLFKETIAYYSKYVRLKNYGEDNEFSEEMVNYPAEKDYDFYETFLEQKMELMMDTKNDDFENSMESVFRHIDISVKLDNDNLYKLYLENSFCQFIDKYLKANYFDELLDYKKNINRIYIGNEVCHNLFPSLDMLIKMLNKAKRENLNITLCFTYLRECYIDKTKALLDNVYSWCSENNIKIEVVINDWGMVSLLSEKADYFSINLGILLNKRRKDPRYMYKMGIEDNNIKLNSLNIGMYSDFLKQNNISRYEYECCGYKMKIADGNHSLHMPFYQTNTSQYCTLYAMCENLDRGCQILVNNCPKYCRDYVFSYPKHLKMVGYYNSLFGFDSEILKNPGILKYYIQNGIDRIVLDFL